MTSPGIYKIRQQEKETGIYTWFIDNDITGKTFHLVVDSSMQPKQHQSAYSHAVINFVKGWSAKDRHELYVEYGDSQGQVFWKEIVTKLQQRPKELILGFEKQILPFESYTSSEIPNCES